MSRSVSHFPLHATLFLLSNYAHVVELFIGGGRVGSLLHGDVGNLLLRHSKIAA